MTPTRRIKVLHVISSLKRGGRERQLSTIMNYTDHERFPSKIMFFNDSQPNYIEEYNLQDKSIKIQSKKSFDRLIELSACIRKEKPDIIYTWGNMESVFILLLSPWFGFKFINGSIRHGIRSKKGTHYFRTIILHLSRNIVANSKAGLLANGLKRGYVLYNGLDEKFFTILKEKQGFTVDPEIKRKISPYKSVLISVANLVPYKDYFTVIRALSELKRKGYSFVYLIIGDGPLKAEIEHAIKENNLVQEVILLGQRSDVKEILSCGNIFIHSSKGEGCSNAIIEALVNRLPVIATDTGGTNEIINEHHGILFPYGDHASLTQHIEYLLTNEENCHLMSNNAQEYASTHFNSSRMMENYYSILTKIAN